MSDGPLVAPTDDIALLCSVAGQLANERVLEELASAGYGDVRTAHGYIFQGLLAGDSTTTALADRLGISVQAVSKSVIELERAGYLRRSRSDDDGRARTIELAERGVRMIAASRAARRGVANDLVAGLGPHDCERLAALLRRAVEHLGGADAIASRRLRPPA